MKTGQNRKGHPVLGSHLNTPGLENLCPQDRHFQALLVTQAIDEAGARDPVRVGRIDSVHVRIDQAIIRIQCCCKGYGREIRSPPAQRQDFPPVSEALETGHDGTFTPAEAFDNFRRIDG
jgi:hypothetical protein